MYGELTKQSGNYPHIITTELFEKTRMIVGRIAGRRSVAERRVVMALPLGMS